MSGYEFSALRPGEKSRKCSKCGADFTPASRTQKKCPECGKKKNYLQETRASAIDGKRSRRELNGKWITTSWD